MTKRERILRAINLEEVDFVPTLGGWLTSASHLQQLSRTTPEEYWLNPESATIRAYKELDTDGLVGLFMPPAQNQYRGITP